MRLTNVADNVFITQIPCSTRHLETVRRFVEDHAREARLSPAAVEECKLAADEACTNVMKHAYGCDSAKKIEVAVIVDRDRFTVRIRDEGLPFRAELYREPDVARALKQRRRGGLGVHIMRSMMDEVTYHKHGRVNEVHLTKYRNGE
ncbi:MAG TPA: ATP-binding protein [Rhodothermales bacterium]